MRDSENSKAPIAESVFKCEECEYTCDKEMTLKKHNNTNHLKQRKQNSKGQECAIEVKFNCDEFTFASFEH